MDFFRKVLNRKTNKEQPTNALQNPNYSVDPSFKTRFNESRVELESRFNFNNDPSNDKWNAFYDECKNRRSNSSNQIVSKKYQAQGGNEAINESGDLDLLGQYYFLRQNLVTLNKQLDSKEFKKLNSDVQKQVKGKIIEMNDLFKENKIFDNPQDLKNITLVPAKEILFDDKNNNKSMQLQLHDLRNGKPLDSLNNNHQKISEEIVKFRQETTVIISSIMDYNKKDLKNIQNHIDSELNKDYKALQENWKRRQENHSTEKENNVVIRQNSNEIRQRRDSLLKSNSWQESMNNKTNEQSGPRR